MHCDSRTCPAATNGFYPLKRSDRADDLGTAKMEIVEIGRYSKRFLGDLHGNSSPGLKLAILLNVYQDSTALAIPPNEGSGRII